MNTAEFLGRRAAPRQTALRIAVVQGALPDDWRDIHEAVERSVRGGLGRFLKITAGSAGTLAAVAAGWALRRAAAELLPETSGAFLFFAALLPAALAGAAAGQFAGNLFLRAALGLDDSTRRGFATRLSLARCPESWPGGLRRWLFTGDWLGAPAYDLRLPYARIYVEGDAPLTCRGEDALWREIHGVVSGDSLWEAGTNFREISYADQLPSWAEKIDGGDGFDELRLRIGRAEASRWVMHLWRRACRQWPALGANDHPEQARRECFEMHSLTLGDGGRALVVVLRPASFVLELELGHADREAA